MSSSLQTRIRGEISRIGSVNRRNVRIFKEQPWQEISGAFGDLGTFVPIFLALATIQRHSGPLISVSNTLVFSGIANILTGMFFGIPLPVQPMKAIAAVAIANMDANGEFGAAELASSGLFVAACVALLSVTGLLKLFNRIIPVPVVKGIQVGAGLTLAMKSIAMLAPPVPQFPNTWDETVLVAVILTLLLYVAMFPRFPFTLAVVGSFAILAIIGGTINYIVTYPKISPGHPWFSLWDPRPVIVPSPTQFGHGAVRAGLGQLPLTVLNSIIAVVYLSDDLFPDLDTPSVSSIGMSVALMNLVGCWFRAMPVCHGSGGLAGQYRFGARSGASIIFLGTLKLILGLFGSEFALWFCKEFPNIVLALLLFLAGQELAKMGESLNSEAANDLWEDCDAGEEAQRDSQTSHEGERKFVPPGQQERTRRWTVMSATIIALLGAKNDGIGFIAGMVMHGVYNAQDYSVKRWEQRAGQIRLGEGGDQDHETRSD